MTRETVLNVDTRSKNEMRGRLPRKRSGQSWSMDLVIAVVVFGFIAVVFYSLLTIQQRPSVDELQVRAQQIENRLGSNIGSCGPIIQGQTITMEQLRCLYAQDPAALHQELGVPGNFCIYVEDSDGTILVVQNQSGYTWTAIGDNALIVGGQPCGEPIPPTP